MSQAIFRPGERIALPYLPILKVENDVAILKKSRFAVGAECGAKHRVRIEAPFPPRRVAQYNSTEPTATELKPEEVA